MSTSDNSDVVAEVCQSLLFLLPPSYPHSYTTTPGSLRGNNQCSTAESNQAAHALAGIQTHHPLIRGSLCLRTAIWTSDWISPANLSMPWWGFEPTTLSSEEIGTHLSMHDHGYLDYNITVAVNAFALLSEISGIFTTHWMVPQVFLPVSWCLLLLLLNG